MTRSHFRVVSSTHWHGLHPNPNVPFEHSTQAKFQVARQASKTETKIKHRLQSLVRISEKRKQVWTARQFGSISKFGGFTALEQFKSIVHLSNAGPCDKNCLLNEIHKRIKYIRQQRHYIAQETITPL